MAVSMVNKRQALAAFCQAKLEAHHASLNASQRYRRQTEPQASRRERIKVMGDPAYYLEVLDAGPTVMTMEDEHLRYVGGKHRFRVSLWLQYSDHASYALSSQKRFDDMVESTDDDAPGLLHALRTEALGDVTALDSDGETTRRLRFSQPEGDEKDVIPLDESATEVAHYLTFEISIREW